MNQLVYTMNVALKEIDDVVNTPLGAVLATTTRFEFEYCQRWSTYVFVNAAGAEFRVILGYVRERIYYSFMTYTSAIRYFPPSFRFLSVITAYLGKWQPVLKFLRKDR